ncbi:alpha-L-fucosidase [Streptomyces sp. NA04227]|uniref:alpha-L-fucosidase n=1 Tax=Streptomyces sp. NA04227 TaxID=2742136 RepID=UPI001590F752|nr:alpha-L-fucosidase [Streptomyces sp. NA04227]QKW06441.1 alpha-L-fucosidase [Streptomyces sp. NA04227]
MSLGDPHVREPRTRRTPRFRKAVVPLLGAALLATVAPAVQAAPASVSAPSAAARAEAPATGPGTNYATDDPFTSSRTSWYRQDKFGMFIHFGAYSNLEGEYTRPDGSVCRNAEWIMRQCAIPKDAYEKQAAGFNPAQFDAKAVVKAAKAAGQRYIVITTKHHDGYAMWPTKQNTWNLRDHSAFDKNRDILAELKRESDAAGIKLGFYYSIWDWHDPDFADPATFPQYKKRMYAQLKELVEGYDPALFWFDGEWDADNPRNRWSRRDGAELETYLRGLDPDLVINNRVGKRGVVEGDFGTPEQEIPGETVPGQLWESCMTINNSWGYAKHDENWKSPTTLIRHLNDIAGRGGNFLLNIGPDRLGRIPQPSVDRLAAMGDWLRSAGQGESVYGSEAADQVVEPSWGSVSRKGDKLYAAVHEWPAAGKSLHLTGRTPLEVTKARVLGSEDAVRVTASGDGIDLTPSGSAPDASSSVIELSLKPTPAAGEDKGTGLRAESFANETFSGPPAVTSTDATVNESYRFDGSPAASIPADHFSTRWTGRLEPRYSEEYTLTTVSDDTARVWIDGKLVIDAGTPHGPRVDQGKVTLKAGQKHTIKVEHTEGGGEAHMKLIWSSPHQSQQVVPATRLYTP